MTPRATPMKSGAWMKIELLRRVVLNSMLLAAVGCGGAALESSEALPAGEEAQLSNSEGSISALGLSGRVVHIRARHSWQCLDVLGGSYQKNAPIVQHPCHNGDNQRFLLEDRGNGYYRVRAMHSAQCMDLQGGSYNPSTPFMQHPCHDGDNQQFLIEDLGTGYYSFRVKHSWQVLDVLGGSYDPSTRLIQHPWHGSENQQFRIE